MSESIHAQRGKKWGKSAYIAEWHDNAVKLCRDDPDGKRDFEAWVMHKFGPVEGLRQLGLCYRPRPKVVITRIASSFDLRSQLEMPARDLGITCDAMVLYTQFAQENNAALPKATKPAPKRRRGESSIDWLARRQEALQDGCKAPNMDWGTARAIAVSELDRTRDTIRLWRTDPDVFLRDVKNRSESYIPSDVALAQLQHSPERVKLLKMDDAFRALVRGLSLSHMTWSYAVDLFDDLDRGGLTTSSLIERAYKKDPKLMWRFVSLFTKVNVLHNYLLNKLADALSWSEHFRPYFIRSRGSDGLPTIKPNETAIGEYDLPEVEDMVVRAACDIQAFSQAFYVGICGVFKRNPSQAKKFSEDAFDVLGDVAIVHEFWAQGMFSPFAVTLREIPNKVTAANCHKHPDFYPQMTFMDPAKYAKLAEYGPKQEFGYARTVADSIGQTLVEMVTRISLHPLGQSLRQMENISRAEFNTMWSNNDHVLWNLASVIDWQGQHGTVAKHLGLFNPWDPNRPTFTKRTLGLSTNTLHLEPAPSSSTILPPEEQLASWSYASGDARAMSGHAFLSENKEGGSKDKIKTRGAPGSEKLELEQAVTRNLFEDEDEVMGFPDVLPAEFKLGKKNMKIFHRILDPRNDTGEVEDQSEVLKRGQVRWGDFEKAMKRVGFAVCQTAGSSVRFDPPAKTARPITFHRPHPDSTLTPRLMKLVGARLKRCYGWTMSTFIQGADDG